MQSRVTKPSAKCKERKKRKIDYQKQKRKKYHEKKINCCGKIKSNYAN